MMSISEAEFDRLLTAALYKAAELDIAGMPSEDELKATIKPSPRFERRMQALLRNPNRYMKKRQRPIYLQILRNVAAVFVACIIIFGTVMVASPTARARVIGFVSTWLSDRTVYSTEPGFVEGTWTLGYIPEGFVLDTEMINELQVAFDYRGEDTQFFAVEISKGQGIVDNEGYAFYQTTINGRPADVYDGTGTEKGNIIVMYDEPTEVIITVVGYVDIDELTKIAENVNNQQR